MTGERIVPEVLAADLARERSTVLVAERGGSLRACAHVADDGGVGYFGMFAVAPDEQGSGLGKLLLAEAESHASTQWGLSTMQMTVLSARTELIEFYERRGYRRTGATKPFPYGDERFGVPQRDDLEFAVLEKSLLPG